MIHGCCVSSSFSKRFQAAGPGGYACASQYSKICTRNVRHVNNCFFTRVAVDDNRKPIAVKPCQPESGDGHRCHTTAALRKEMRQEIGEDEFARVSTYRTVQIRRTTSLWSGYGTPLDSYYIFFLVGFLLGAVIFGLHAALTKTLIAKVK